MAFCKHKIYLTKFISPKMRAGFWFVLRTEKSIWAIKRWLSQNCIWRVSSLCDARSWLSWGKAKSTIEVFWQFMEKRLLLCTLGPGTQTFSTMISKVTGVRKNGRLERWSSAQTLSSVPQSTVKSQLLKSFNKHSLTRNFSRNFYLILNTSIQSKIFSRRWSTWKTAINPRFKPRSNTQSPTPKTTFSSPRKKEVATTSLDKSCNRNWSREKGSTSIYSWIWLMHQCWKHWCSENKSSNLSTRLRRLECSHFSLETRRQVKLLWTMLMDCCPGRSKLTAMRAVSTLGSQWWTPYLWSIKMPQNWPPPLTVTL